MCEAVSQHELEIASGYRPRNDVALYKNKNLVKLDCLTRYTSRPAEKAALTIVLSDKAFMPSLYYTGLKRLTNGGNDFISNKCNEFISLAGNRPCFEVVSLIP